MLRLSYDLPCELDKTTSALVDDIIVASLKSGATYKQITWALESAQELLLAATRPVRTQAVPKNGSWGV